MIIDAELTYRRSLLHLCDSPHPTYAQTDNALLLSEAERGKPGCIGRISQHCWIPGVQGICFYASWRRRHQFVEQTRGEWVNRGIPWRISIVPGPWNGHRYPLIPRSGSTPGTVASKDINATDLVAVPTIRQSIVDE